jgi:phosphoribosylanthranilate isomerase
MLDNARDFIEFFRPDACHEVAGDQSQVRLQRGGTLERRDQVARIDLGADMQIAQLHDPHSFERLRQVREDHAPVIDADPVGFNSERVSEHSRGSGQHSSCRQSQ